MKGTWPAVPSPSTSRKTIDVGQRAVLWHAGESGRVVCDLCAHRCTILPGRPGICQVRVNAQGELRTLCHNRLIAAHVDPIEKKPFFHFLPGTRSYSIATVGCNFRCRYCQNWQISQAVREFKETDGTEIAPEKVVAAAIGQACDTIAYTYTEPTIFFETCESVGLLARGAGLRNLFVTNGYLTREAVARASTFLDAANVDLKGFDDGRYRRVCGATLKGVLEGLELLLAAGVWVEVTTLVVPGVNDSDQELRSIALHLAGLGRSIPWHISRFHPDYKMLEEEATPVATLERAYALGREAGLDYVYVGNVPGHPGESTFCPNCATMVITREGFTLSSRHMRNGACSRCGAPVAGVFSD